MVVNVVRRKVVRHGRAGGRTHRVKIGGPFITHVDVGARQLIAIHLVGEDALAGHVDAQVGSAARDRDLIRAR